MCVRNPGCWYRTGSPGRKQLLWTSVDSKTHLRRADILRAPTNDAGAHSIRRRDRMTWIWRCPDPPDGPVPMAVTVTELSSTPDAAGEIYRKTLPDRRRSGGVPGGTQDGARF